MAPEDLFETYESLVSRADRAFQRMTEQYPECVQCKRHCSDCCHAAFGLFLIEAAYVQHHFGALDRNLRRAAIQNGKKSDRQWRRLQEKLEALGSDPEKGSDLLSRERVACPLLNKEKDCILYAHRPITCRVYGIPTAIHGRAHVCAKAGFKEGTSYPVFNLDEVQKTLYALSRKFLEGIPHKNPENADLLISVSKALNTPMKRIIEESFS